MKDERLLGGATWLARLVLAVLIVIGLFAVEGMAATPPGGPGPHWVDVTPAGVDLFSSSVIEFGVDLTFDGIPEFDAVFVTSPTDPPVTVHRSDPLDDSLTYPGLRAIDGHLDVIDTEIVSMSLTGGGAAAGWTLRAGVNSNVSSAPGHVGPRPSLGAIAELPADPALAASFFDVFFEIDATPFGMLHNDTALRIGTIIDRVPPPTGTDYGILELELEGVPATQQFPLFLFDDNEQAVAQLTSLTNGGGGHHLIIPEPAGLGLVGLVLLAVRKRRT